MEYSLTKMPDHARLWVYQADRPFTDEEIVRAKEMIEAFLNVWTTHGKALKAGFSIELNQFVVLAVDESFQPASGCSIDSSVQLIRQLESAFRIGLLDRTMIGLWRNDRVEVYPLDEVKTKLANGEIKKETLMFNNHLNVKEEWEAGWKIPVEASWLKRYIKLEV